MIFTSAYRQLTKAHDDDAGFDIFADPEQFPTGWIEWKPFEVKKVFTTLRVSIPKGYVGRVSERSGFPSRGVPIRIAGGIIDPGYYGEVVVFVQNVSPEPLELPIEKAIAQLVVHSTLNEVTRIPQWEFDQAVSIEQLPQGRGISGFGSSDQDLS